DDGREVLLRVPELQGLLAGFVHGLDERELDLGALAASSTSLASVSSGRARDRLGDFLDNGEQPRVDDQLEPLTCAGAADPARGLSDRAEDRLAPLPGLLRARREDDELTLLGRLLRPPHRRVDEDEPRLDPRRARAGGGCCAVRDLFDRRTVAEERD